MSRSNPFTPSFGQIPPFMAGRADIIADMELAFDRGPGDPNLSTIFVGSRGTGKTALLSYLSEMAGAYGWVSANVTAEQGMLEDVIERSTDAANQFVSEPSSMRLTGVSVGKLFGLDWEYRSEHAGNWRTRMNRLLDELERCDIGLLITVDEVRSDLGEMISLASAYQHFVRERRRVALVMAGLPGNVSGLLQDKTVSFLRRAFRHRLGRISNAEIEEAFRKSIEESGRSIGGDALAIAVDAIDGFPYLMQLLGYRAWDRHPENPEISLDDVRRAADLARREMDERIYDATFYDLSEGDRRFLFAMLEDAGPSSVADIAKRLGESSGYASVYKSRLLEQGILGEKGRGFVSFELPGFKDYLSKRMAEL